MRNYIAVLILLSISFLTAQTDTETYFAEDVSQEIDDRLEELEELKEHPVYLTINNLELLIVIPDINSFDIAILKEILSYNTVKKDQDLLDAGFPITKLELISPYITFQKRKPIKLNIRTEHAYKDSQFYNNRLRIKVNANSLEAGIIADRDPQEDIKDIFTSLYIQKQTEKFRLILGNYRLKWGAGILHASSFSRYFSRSATSTLNHNHKTLYPYYSTTEDGYFKGAAIEYSKNRLRINSWLSQTNFKNKQKHGGSSIQYSSNHVLAGICLERTYQDSSATYLPARDITDSFSLSAACSFDRLSVQSELARSAGSNAGVINLQYGSSKFKQIILFRSYQNGFPQLYGNPISRTSDFSGEQGLYYGLSWKIIPALKADFYTDFWKNNQITKTPYIATLSKEQMLNLVWSAPCVETSGYIRYRTYDDDFCEDNSPESAQVRVLSAKASCQYEVLSVTLRSDLNYKSENVQNISFTKSIACFQQLSWTLGKFQLWYRISFFKAELPLYVYENNVRGLSTTVCFSDDGFRNAFKIKYSASGYRMEFKAYIQSTSQINKGVSLAVSAKI